MAEHYWDPELDTLPWDQVLEWQRARLPEFVEGLRERSIFHAGQLAGVSTDRLGESWGSIPFVEKAQLRELQQSGDGPLLGAAQGVPDAELVQVLASSGTTGSPTFFGLTERDRRNWEFSIANMFFTAGVRQSSVVALAVAMPLVAGGLPYGDAIRRIGATLAWVGGQTPARMAQMIKRLKVDTMVSTASFATFFAERSAEVLGHPASELSLRTMIGGGEPGLAQPEIRNRVAQEWGADRVSETMGLGDVMSGLWGECAEAGGMHYTGARNVLVELIDPDDGRPVAWEPGAMGEAVYTTFTREATPVVRFRSRDHLRIEATCCPCGRTSPRVRCVGRTDDMLIYKAMNVFPSAIRDVVLDDYAALLPGPMRIRKERVDQVRFDRPIPLEIELDVRGADAETVKRGIEDAVRQKLRVQVAVEFGAPGTIPLAEYKNSLVYVKEA
ncbi:phenylacetate--CoA ligase family protein [Nonomuraea harbinensis]|uniref:Phenylacetate--CoA ligase family protein n=1 Tax=Nonomuraea harbinensis TaxID=1286938 RepID=A0ABW1CB69_9ACTN|nr:hypothetical protein [Nonomuraea harbinensis]